VQKNSTLILTEYYFIHPLVFTQRQTRRMYIQKRLQRIAGNSSKKNNTNKEKTGRIVLKPKSMYVVKRDGKNL
jgi:hypothetical protein